MSDINLRASALPLAFRCPASIRRGDLIVNTSHPAAADGTAAHELLSTLPSTGLVDWGNVEATARKHGADPEETRMLVAMGTKLWNETRGSFAGAMAEVPLRLEVAPGIVLTGHADLIAVSQTSIRVADWKTGRKDHNHYHQFMAYAVLALLSYDGIQDATATGLWVRDQEIENYTITRAQAQAWVEDLVRFVVNWDGVYRPGEQNCIHCSRSHECAAANALARRDIAALSDRSLSEIPDQLATMSGADILDLFHKASFVTTYAERFRNALRQYAIERGPIEADGVELSIDEEKRREIDPLKAWPVLEELGFGDEEFSRVVTIRGSEIDKVLRERAPRGEKKKQVEACKQALENAGAVGFRTIQKLRERRV